MEQRTCGIFRLPTVWAHLHFCQSKRIGEPFLFHKFQEVYAMKKVGIVMGSDSDLPVIRKATDMLLTEHLPKRDFLHGGQKKPVSAC